MYCKKIIYACQSVSGLKGRALALIAMMILSCHYMQAAGTGKTQAGCEAGVGNTDPLSEFYAYGLPQDAYPAAYSDYNIPYAQLSPEKKRNYLIMSSLQSEDQPFGVYYFFIQPIAGSDEDDFGEYYNIYMFDKSAKVLTKIFSHHVDKYVEMQVDDIYWDYDIKTYNKPYTSKTGVKGTFRVKKAEPVVVLSCRDRGGTPHAIPLTVIINPAIHKHKVLEEQFVGFLRMNDSVLMSAEQGLTKRMILTTATVTTSKDLPKPKDADIFSRSYLAPSINVYSTAGVKLGGLNLPHDEIDCLR
jgi:lipoprotein